jgi:hypothetical protein
MSDESVNAKILAEGLIRDKANAVDPDSVKEKIAFAFKLSASMDAAAQMFWVMTSEDLDKASVRIFLEAFRSTSNVG